MDIIKQYLNPIFRPGSLNLIFRPRGPSKQVGDAFECIWGVFCIEVACRNYWNHVTIEEIQTLCDFHNFEELFCQPFAENTFPKHTPKMKKRWLLLDVWQTSLKFCEGCMIARQQNKVPIFQGVWPNPGPGLLPLHSGRRDIEFASVFASVVSLAVSFVSECIFWNLVEKK